MLNRVCCCNMFQCCSFPDCFSTSNMSVIYHFAFPMKNKKLLKHWVHVIRRANPPLNRHTRTCSKHFVNAEGRRLYSDEVPSLTTTEAWETTEESLQDIDLQVWAMSLSQLSLLYGSLVARSSVGPPVLPLRSRHGLSLVANFPFSLRAGSSCSMP